MVAEFGKEKSAAKKSQEGNGDTQIGNIVADENLTEPLKLLKNFGKAIGANVVLFSNSNKDFHGAHVDFAKMSDPLERDKAREDLPYLKRLRTQYLRHDVQSRPDRKDYFAAKIEYARRCFENAERTRAVSANAVVGNERQRGVYKSRTSIITRNDPRGTGEIIRRSDGGISRSVSGEKKGAREHFLKLYEEEETRRSEKQNQGVVNLGAKFSRTGEDNTAGTFDEDDEISQAVFDTYLGEDTMKKLREFVAKQIGTSVNLSDMDDPVKRDEAKKKLDLIRKMRVMYNQRSNASKNPNRKSDELAVAIEYARECFDNDERIRSRAVHQVVDGDTKGRIHQSNNATFPRFEPSPSGRNSRRTGVSRAVDREVDASHERFLEILETLKETRRSEKQNQGVINLGAKFSIGSDDSSGSSSDNSSEGFLQRVKNLLTGRPNQSNERIRKRINTMLSNLTGVKIAAGHMNNGMDIVVKDIEKVIRTNRAYDWANLLPAVGQKISVIISLRPSESMNNYIADWLMTGALNNTSAEATEFAKALRKEENFEIRNQLLEIQSTFYEWRNMTPSERIQATIEFERPKPSLRERAKSVKDESYQQFFEELEPVNDLVKEWEKITGEKLADAVNPYVLFRNYRGIAGRAKLLIEGDGTVINALRQMFPNLKWDGFKTIKMILSDVGALENEKTRREFSAFCEAKHVKDLFNKNREIQANMKKVQDRITELEGMKSQTTDAKRIKDLDRRINQNQEKFKTLEESLYRTPFSEADCDAMIRDYAQKYGQAQKDLVSFSRKTLAILRDSGVISDQAYIEMARAWKNYVPMHRVFDDNEDVRFGDSLKKMVGSDRDTVDPLQSIIRNTYDYIRRAEKNTAKLMLASMARTGGVGMLVEEVDGKQPDDKTTIAFFENGVKKYLQTDVSVVRAVNNMSPPQMSWFMKFIRIGTMLLRNFATVFNPAFAARNLVRDWQDAALYSKYGFFSPMDFVRGFIHAVKQDDVYSEWMAAGGAQASFWSVDRDYTEASINSLTKQGLKKYTSLKGFLDLFSRLGEWSELGTRIGYFEKAKKELAKNNGGIINRADLVTAALESRDLMDFARGGTASRTWNNAVAFANASLQGWDKFFRTFDFRKSWSKDPQVRKEWLRATFRLALTSVVPAVLCFLLNYDDDWYKNDLKDYEKQNYWILGENLRIPKGMDLGTRFFSNLTEEILNSTYNKDPKAFTSFWKPFVDSMPGLIPTGLAPIWENFTNYDMFRQRAIVPQYLQKLPAASQYNANTTSIAKFIGETANISPLKVDHFIFGYTGNMGREILRVGETVTGFRDYNFKFPKDLPLIGGFFRMPYQNPKVLSDFYEALDEQTAWRNEYKATNKKPEGYDEKIYQSLHTAQKAISELSKLERKLMLDPKLSGEEKQKRQLSLQKKRVALAEKALR